MEGFRQRMTSCFGLPGNATLDSMESPLIAVINLPSGQHRSLRNGKELTVLLHASFKDQGAIVRHMRFQESMTVQEQAAVLSKISILGQVRNTM